MTEEKANKHLVINNKETLSLYNSAKAKVTQDNLDKSRLSDNDILHYILNKFLGEISDGEKPKRTSSGSTNK